MAYHKPVRFFFKGDKKKAGRYIRDARRFIAQLIQQFGDGVTSGRRRKILGNGVMIEVTVADGVVMAVIDVTVEKKPLRRKFDDFVVHARDQTYPDGIDVDHPQQILRPPHEDGASWTTYFYDQSTVQYQDFDRKKGTYANNPDGTDLFPDGIVHAGNIDWRGPDGERISWYGPSCRYWFDGWRQPSAQYGKFVFNMGEILLDVDQYCIDNAISLDERQVMGAGIRLIENERWLYVVLSAIDDIPFDATPIVPPQIYFSENFPTQTITLSLHRFRMTRDTLTPNAMKWSIVDGTHEELFVGSAYRGCNPWVFNLECTKATTFLMQGAPVFVFSDSFGFTLANDPPAVNERIDFLFEDGVAVTFENTSHFIPIGAGAGLMAVDYDEEGQELRVEMVRHAYEGSPNALHLRVGDWEVPMWFIFSVPDAGWEVTTVRASIVWMDARTRSAVFDNQRYSWRNSSPPWAWEIVRVQEFWTDGTMQSTLNVGTIGDPSAAGPGVEERSVNMLNDCATKEIAPMAFLMGLRGIASGPVLAASIIGLQAANARVIAPPDDTFGGFRAVSSGPPVVPLSLANFARATFNNNRQDVHGHRSPVGAAAYEGYMAASIYTTNFSFDTNPDENSSTTFVTGSDLPTLTGVGGDDARYHPIWLMGKPIGGDKPPV